MLAPNENTMLVTRAGTITPPRGITRSERNELADILAEGAVQAGFQPVVELATGRVVGWEALARGPRGSALERPDHLFAAARAAGRLEELDWLCQRNALRRALEAGVRSPCILFLNIEPDTSGFLPLELRDLYARASGQMTVCVEVTERALTQRPGALLGHVADMRAMGVAVALDDVGTDADTLAMMSLLAPEVIKLDLALVQNSPDAEIAEVVHAVAAQAERSGATILVEGVETPEQARAGDALGATLAQGWLYGRREIAIDLPAPPDGMVVQPGRHRDPRDLAPFELVAGGRPPRPATQPLLLAMTEHLEDQAGGLGRTAVLVAAFDRDRRFTDALRGRYARLGADLAFCAVMGRDVPADVAPGVHGAAPGSGDPVHGEWTIAVVGPHYAAALVAHERSMPGPDGEPVYDYVLTYDRGVATAVAASLTARVAA
ncbi:MAG: EAL domain-containing protein [Solirubrobacteraceae bacterium]|jgi:EAL domain-containing protein (putative c-di-GMP-specific phosphodiesterase class I)|nr:EAL domain-containing protein [Solirubrobacteraceae bacterium]MCU0313652.1 EAL domain-containing protein [Solirubrobacteraceae bacterium]